MTDQSEKNIHREPQEEFIDERNTATRKGKESRTGPTDYNKWTMDDLQREARDRKIKGYMKMERKQLIHNLIGDG